MSKFFKTDIQDRDIFKYIVAFSNDLQLKGMVMGYKNLTLKCGAFNKNKFIYNRKRVIDNILDLTKSDTRLVEIIMDDWEDFANPYITLFNKVVLSDVALKDSYDTSNVIGKLCFLVFGWLHHDEKFNSLSDELFIEFENLINLKDPDFNNTYVYETIVLKEMQERRANDSYSDIDEEEDFDEEFEEEFEDNNFNDDIDSCNIDICNMSMKEMHIYILKLNCENLSLKEQLKEKEEEIERLKENKESNVLRDLKREIKAITNKMSSMEKDIKKDLSKINNNESGFSLTEKAIKSICKEAVVEASVQTVKDVNESIINSQNSTKGYLSDLIVKNSKHVLVAAKELEKIYKEIAISIDDSKNEKEKINISVKKEEKPVIVNKERNDNKYNLDEGISKLVELL